MPSVDLETFLAPVAISNRYTEILKIAEEDVAHEGYSDTPLWECRESQKLNDFVKRYALDDKTHSSKLWDEAECIIARKKHRFSTMEIDKVKHKHEVSQLVAFLTGAPIVVEFLSMPFSESSLLYLDTFTKWRISICFFTFIISWIYIYSSKQRIEKMRLFNEAAEIIYSNYRIANVFKDSAFYEHIKRVTSGIKNETLLAYYNSYINWYEETLTNIEEKVCARYRIKFSKEEYKKLQEAKQRNKELFYSSTEETEFVKSLIMASVNPKKKKTNRKDLT